MRQLKEKLSSTKDHLQASNRNSTSAADDEKVDQLRQFEMEEVKVWC